MIVGKMRFYEVWKSKISTPLKKRRFNKLMRLVCLPDDRPIRILEVGCANGKDFIQFAQGARYDICAVDLLPGNIAQENVRCFQADAAHLPFEDKSFDLVVSIGLLEHIEPMEKLCTVIHEFDRVGVHQISAVPSVSSFIEPHSAVIRFPMRLRAKFCGEQPGVPLHLNFLTDHTWTKFEGFSDCKVKPFYYLPPLIRNIAIYR